MNIGRLVFEGMPKKMSLVAALQPLTRSLGAGLYLSGGAIYYKEVSPPIKAKKQERGKGEKRPTGRWKS